MTRDKASLLETLRERSIPLLSMYGVGRRSVTRLSSDQIDAVFSILEALQEPKEGSNSLMTNLSDEKLVEGQKQHAALIVALRAYFEITEIEAIELIRTLDTLDDVRELRPI